MASFDQAGNNRRGAASPQQQQPLNEKSRRGTFVISPVEKEDKEDKEEGEKKKAEGKGAGVSKPADLVTYSVVIQYMKVGSSSTYSTQF